MEFWEIWFAVFAVLGFAIVAPVWLHFVDGYLTGRPVMQILSTMVMPITALLLVASWLQPG